MGGVASSGGFAATFQNLMYYVGPIVQILFWIVVGYAAVWAAMTFKRLVDFKTGAVAAKEETASKVSVEEFVE